MSHTITLTDKEVFILNCALEGFADADDGEYIKAIEISYDIANKLPEVDVVWKDVE
jgi:hypothetical protein